MNTKFYVKIISLVKLSKNLFYNNEVDIDEIKLIV